MKRLAVLISGRGSNLQSLIQAQAAHLLGGEICLVLANKAEAGGLLLAKKAGIATEVIEHKNFPSRAAFDATLTEVLDANRIDTVILAGFMRVLTPEFVQAFEGELINIHPSLLPSFPGLDTHQRAIDTGCQVHGCTVHYVTATLDAGPIIAQAAVPVLPDDTAASLGARVLLEEHRLLPQAVRWHCEGRLQVEGLRVHVRAAL
jgi:phosphoribosylglycinamide formyltransferase 1